MSRRGEELSARRLRELLDELSAALDARGEQAQLFIVGGAAMALAYDDTRTTRDIDALFEPRVQVRAIAAEIGQRHNLDEDWLNDAAKGFMPGSDAAARTVYTSDALVVLVPSPQYMLAMKLHASRDERDLEDAATLANLAGVITPQGGVELLSKMYPPSTLLPRHRYVVNEVMERAASKRTVQSRRGRSTPPAPPMPPMPAPGGPSGPGM